MKPRHLAATLLCSAFVFPACTGDGGDDSTTMADGDTGTSGDGDTTGEGDGDGDASGDGDGDTSGDGDGDPTGDGDGDTGGGAACMGELAPAGTLAIGEPVSHWAGFTTEGEDWDYCMMEGTPFLLVLSAGWCGPCQDLASGMSGGPTSFENLAPVIAGLEAGTLGFVEVLVDNYIDFGPTSLADLQMWEASYPNEHIHLIGDPTPGTNGQEPLWIYLSPSHMGSVPAGVLVDAEFNLEVMILPTALSTAGSKYGG